MSTRRKLHMRNIIKKALKASRGRKEPAYVPVFHSSSKIRRTVVLYFGMHVIHGL